MIRAILIACLLAGSFAVPVGHAETARVLPDRPVHTLANVSALSSSSAKRVRNGETVTTAGYTTAGDGGGNAYVYRSTGRSGITADGGWYINGPGSDDYFEAADKSVANVRKFGAKGDNSTDDTAAFNAARNAINSALESGQQEYKTLYVPGGRYRINFVLSSGDNPLDSISIKGDGAATKIYSYADGEFAITLEDNEQARTPYFWNTIEDVSFVGDHGGVNKRCGGIAATTAVRLVNVRFHQCAVGVAITDAFYSSWRSLSFSSCDIGVLNGSYYGPDDDDIADLIDGDAQAHSMVFPGVAESPSYSGNRLIDDIRFNQCRIGFAAIGNSNSNLRRTIITKGSWESCGTAILMDEGTLDLQRPWFENNSSGSSTTFQGVTVAQGDITFVDQSAGGTNYGSRIVSNGGKGPNVVTHATYSHLVIEGAADVTATSFDPKTVLHEIRADNGLSNFVLKPHSNTPHSNQAIGCYVLPKVARVPGQPPNGRVILAETFEGTTTDSPLILDGATATYEVADGVWDSDKCVELSISANNDGYRFPSTAYVEFGSGKTYTAVLACKHEFNGQYAGNAQDVFVTDSIDLESEKWTWIGLVGGGATTSAAPRFRFNLDAGESTPQYIRVSALQIIEWDNGQDAADYMATPYFYEVEGI